MYNCCKHIKIIICINLLDENCYKYLKTWGTLIKSLMMSKCDMMLYKNTWLYDYTPKTSLNCERYKVSNIQNNENLNLGSIGTKVNLNAIGKWWPPPKFKLCDCNESKTKPWPKTINF
jgi:hypothetical protein